MVRFIHAADIHLDSPLIGLARYEGAPVERLRTATRAAFSALVDAAIAEAVDFMVIAGDLYDGDWRDYNTGLFFCREMGRLREADIPVFLLYGNHDAQSELTKQLRLPPNVRVFPSRKAETFALEHLGVALHGQSFRNAMVVDNLAATYPAPVRGMLNIGVLHTALEGHAAHARYAPCAEADLVAKGYDYWALGHVHEHTVRREDPWIVFPGNLQGRHIRELGARGAVLVTAAGREISLQRCFVDVLRWEHQHIDCRSAATLDDVADLAGSHLEALAKSRHEDRALAVRVTLKGRCIAHGELFGAEHRLRAEVLARAASLGDRVWIEKVCLETTAELSSEELMARSDALDDLQNLLAEASSDARLLQALGEDLGEFVARCPPELVASVGSLQAIREGRLRDLLSDVGPSLLAQLARER